MDEKVMKICHNNKHGGHDTILLTLNIVWIRLFLKTYTNWKLHTILKLHRGASKLGITY
jgi:hypothetical protein